MPFKDPEKERLYRKQWRATHPEQVKARAAKYRANHPETYRLWRQRNSERKKAIDRAYYLANREKIIQYATNYYNAHSDKVKARMLYRYHNDPLLRVKWLARNAVTSALRAGKIMRPEDCEKCGTHVIKPTAHHPDYSQPLKVIWLCRSCHLAIHSTLRQASCGNKT